MVNGCGGFWKSAGRRYELVALRTVAARGVGLERPLSVGEFHSVLRTELMPQLAHHKQSRDEKELLQLSRQTGQTGDDMLNLLGSAADGSLDKLLDETEEKIARRQNKCPLPATR